MNPTFTKIYVSAPSDLSTSSIQGDGWTLELNTGWTVAAGERKGDYVVKKLELESYLEKQRIASVLYP